MEKDNIDNDLQKEIAFLIEKDKLEDTVELIKNEILNYINKRKNFSKNIVEERRYNLEEYRKDEDQVADYFDHEAFINEEAYKTLTRRLKELSILQNSPYFGKVTFREEGLDEEESVYIGRFGMTPEGKYEPVIVDWRAPVSSLFYTENAGKASYMAPGKNIAVDILAKRQFIIKNEKLEGMFDSDIDIKDEVLQMVLSKNSSKKLKDIIMTIQAEQDNIIRQPYNKAIIVDGTAGSGKTTIALHRVAYLLYNYRDKLQDKVLILGPNSIFMDYISTVLPSLGEIGVAQQTFKEFAMDILKLKNVMSFKEYMERIINKDEELTNDFLVKVSPAFMNRLDQLVEYMNYNYYNIQQVSFPGKTIVTKQEIEELFNKYYKDMPLFRRARKIKRIIYSKIRDERDERVRKIQTEYIEKKTHMTAAELEVNGNSLEYLRKLKIRNVIQDVINCKKALSWLKEGETLTIYDELNDNMPLTEHDLAPIIYLKIKLEGFKLKKEYKHIVIDEAQDYSMIQFIVLRELTGCNAFTIVGDSNQRLLPVHGQIPMKEIDRYLSGMNIEYFNLYRSYRSTREIMNYAGRYAVEKAEVSLIREGRNVEEASFADMDHMAESIINKEKELAASGYDSIGIICRSLEEAIKLGNKIKNYHYIKIISDEDIILGSGTSIIPSYYSKGLEFDAVILVKPAEEKIDDKLMYVMATRALHELSVYSYGVNSLK